MIQSPLYLSGARDWETAPHLWVVMMARRCWGEPGPSVTDCTGRTGRNLSEAREQYEHLFTSSHLSMITLISQDLMGNNPRHLSFSIFQVLSPVSLVLTPHSILPWEAGSASSEWLSSGRSPQCDQCECLQVVPWHSGSEYWHNSFGISRTSDTKEKIVIAFRKTGNRY